MQETSRRPQGQGPGGHNNSRITVSLLSAAVAVMLDIEASARALPARRYGRAEDALTRRECTAVGRISLLKAWKSRPTKWKQAL